MGHAYNNYSYQEPEPPVGQQLTYTEKVAMMRRPKVAPDPPFSTIRTGEPSGSAPNASSSMMYPYSADPSSFNVQLLAPQRRPKQRDVSDSSPSRTTESATSEVSAPVAGTSEFSSSMEVPRREADAGVRLAGGPQEGWPSRRGDPSSGVWRFLINPPSPSFCTFDALLTTSIHPYSLLSFVWSRIRTSRPPSVDLTIVFSLVIHTL